MPLQPEIVKAYVAEAVIRLAFSPHSDTEKRKWLNLLHRGMPSFWGVENYPAPPRQEGGALRGTLEHGQLQLLVEYQVEANADISARIMFCRENDRDILWHHHGDSGFFRFPERIALQRIDRERPALHAAQREDVEAVVDGLVCHPAAHQHLESPVNRHEIRIGGGIGNAFLFLFHLRFQLCPFPEQRAEERVRLIGLFFDAIQQKHEIAANSLLGGVG